MAEKQPHERPQRTFVDASSGKQINQPVKSASVEKVSSGQGGSGADPAAAKPKRIIAIVLWVVAIAFEVLAVMFLFKKLYFPPNSLVWMIVMLVVDMVCVIIGSQMWKQANHLDPASEADKTKFFIQNQLGAFISVLAFLPFIILVLMNKDSDKQTKAIATIVAVVFLAISGISSVDFNPVSAEDLAAQQQAAETYAIDGNVYWTTFGSVYHLDPNCPHILNSGTIYSGTVAQATDAGRARLCSTCEARAAAGELSTNAANTGTSSSSAAATSTSSKTSSTSSSTSTSKSTSSSSSSSSTSTSTQQKAA